MYEFDKSKLNVAYENGAYEGVEIKDRRYTLTHSDNTGELYLTISDEYDYSKIDNKMRDEVLGKWIYEDDKYHLELFVLAGIDDNIEKTKRRDMVFRQALHLAIKAIIQGDIDSIKKNNIDIKTEIITHFISELEEFNVVEMVGTIEDYVNTII